GQLQLAVFPNEAGLEARGDNLFMETPASGAAQVANPGSAGYGTLLQGFLETSNVNVVAEITNLISAQRAYEMNSRVIKTSDEMLGTVNQMK
ncbi:MAG TPA: flagellar hook-basal body complex protein, partial [Candidatus Omnitrophota bacterium]|nr:flagellar hook-basal body complex protein [Candidatus Omnitrophota bacterium]